MELKGELKSLEADLEEPKGFRSGLVDGDLLRDMYLLYDYPRLTEEFDPVLASELPNVQAAYKDDEGRFLEHLFQQGFRSNDRDHLALAIARFIYFFFNAYPQAAIDFDWNVSTSLADQSGIDARIIAPFIKFVASDWGIESDQLALFHSVRGIFGRFATDAPVAEVQHKFDEAASSEDDSAHISDRDEPDSEPEPEPRRGLVSPRSMLLNIKRNFTPASGETPKPGSTGHRK